MTGSGTHYDYDQVPYPELAFAQTHPDHLAMLGRLLGMNPAAPEHCRVLEIGCASGTNLLPMAAVMPQSTFVGIDLSAVQIQQAVDTAAAAGLTNITFQQKDILDIEPSFGEFDYIIAHGIFSWVPANVREKLLSIFKRNLAPQGIAYLSYNAYPGWHRLEIIRNMMLFRTRDAQTPEEKSAQAREWISFMADALAGETDSAYAAVFTNYLNFRKTQTQEFDHAALLHDELEVNNQPFYFYQVVEQAEQHGLQYLVETDFPQVMPNGLSDEVVEHIASISLSTVEMEQYFDFMRDRLFRCTLFCHAEVEVNRALSINPLQEFYVSSFANEADANAENTAPNSTAFISTGGKQFTTDHALTIAAFRHLLKISPERIRFPELIRQAATALQLKQVDPNDVLTTAANFLRGFSHSMKLVSFHAFVPQMTTETSVKPEATPLARVQARRGSKVINLLHTRVEMENFGRLILANLDGEHDRAAITDFLFDLAEKRKINPKTTSEQPQTAAELREMLATELEKALRQFGLLGLLVS